MSDNKTLFTTWCNKLPLPDDAIPTMYVGQRGFFNSNDGNLTHGPGNSYFFIVEKISAVHLSSTSFYTAAIGALHYIRSGSPTSIEHSKDYDIPYLLRTFPKSMQLDYNLQRVVDTMVQLCAEYRDFTSLVNYSKDILEHVYKTRGKVPVSIDDLLMPYLNMLPKWALSDNLRSAKENKKKENTVLRPFYLA